MILMVVQIPSIIKLKEYSEHADVPFDESLLTPKQGFK